MKLGMALKEKLMDIRLRDKLLADGKISQNEIDQYLASLNDDNQNVAHVEVAEDSLNNNDDDFSIEQQNE